MNLFPSFRKVQATNRNANGARFRLFSTCYLRNVRARRIQIWNRSPILTVSVPVRYFITKLVMALWDACLLFRLSKGYSLKFFGCVLLYVGPKVMILCSSHNVFETLLEGHGVLEGEVPVSCTFGG